MSPPQSRSPGDWPGPLNVAKARLFVTWLLDGDIDLVGHTLPVVTGVGDEIPDAEDEGDGDDDTGDDGAEVPATSTAGVRHDDLALSLSHCAPSCLVESLMSPERHLPVGPA